MATELGGSVGGGDYGGYADVTVDILDDDDPLVGSLAPETRVWASHADEVKEVPEGTPSPPTPTSAASRR